VGFEGPRVHGFDALGSGWLRDLHDDIVESAREIKEAETVTKSTQLAFFLAPLGLVTRAFSTNGYGKSPAGLCLIKKGI